MKKKIQKTLIGSFDSSRLQERLYKIEDGRFAQIISLFEVKEKCEWCSAFNELLGEDCRDVCDQFPYCIGTCLSKEMLSYLNYKLGNITEGEHYANCGIITDKIP